MSVLDRSALEASPLADLHAIASELGLDGFRRLRKADLVDAILARQEGNGGEPADAEADADSDVEAEAEPAPSEDGDADADERRVALGPARRPHRAAQLVTGAQLAAADLRRRHVHVVVRVLEHLYAQEAAAVRQDVEDAGAGLALYLGLVLAVVAIVRTVVAGGALLLGLTPAAARARGLVVAGIGVAGAGPGVVGVAARLAATAASAPALGAVVGRFVIAALGLADGRLTGEERIDQVFATQAAVALDAELGRDGVEVGERALLEFVFV